MPYSNPRPRALYLSILDFWKWFDQSKTLSIAYSSTPHSWWTKRHSSSVIRSFLMGSRLHAEAPQITCHHQAEKPSNTLNNPASPLSVPLPTADIDLWPQPKAGQIYCQISSFISANMLSFKFELCAWGYFPPGQPCSHSGCPWCNGTLFISSERSGQITALLPKRFKFCWFLGWELTLQRLLESLCACAENRPTGLSLLHPNGFALSHLRSSICKRVPIGMSLFKNTLIFPIFAPFVKKLKH